MKNSFTLIELIFVIVIIGLLAAVAIPKFNLSEVSASKVNVKSVVNSVQTAIDNLHGQALINDSFTWDSECDWNSSTDYPKNLDTDTNYLFKCVLRKPILSCNQQNLKRNCFNEIDDNIYRYYFSPTDYLEVEYNESTGLLDCKDSDSFNLTQCKNILY